METLKMLTAIEKKENVKILHAVEAGSRAWGFASPDSDYDVRFIYKRDMDFYLSLSKPNDTLDYPIENDMDIGGWDLKKACELLWKSNMPLFEWLWSPVVYLEDPGFIAEMRELSNEYFSPATAFHHYHNMARKHVELCMDDQVKLKHLFYALRTVFATRWIVINKSFPPVGFLKILEGIPESDFFVERIELLLALKESNGESYRHTLDVGFLERLKMLFDQNSKAEKTLKGHNGSMERLNNFFIKNVKS